MTKTRKGAEATVELRKDFVLKTREKKGYRHPDLDQRIVEERTSKEAKILKKASKYNVSPKLISKKKNSLKMDLIVGKTVKKVIEDDSKLLEKIGKKIATLHRENIVHGDLTTKNMILEEKTNELYIIDFGLAEHSQRVEDKAVDLHLFKEVLRTSHPSVFEESWDKFKESYEKNVKNSEKIFDRLKEIESRGRYK